MDRAGAIERVVSLVRLAADAAAYPGEREAAKNRAEAIMRRFGLGAPDVEPALRGRAVAEASRARPPVPSGPPRFRPGPAPSFVFYGGTGTTTAKGPGWFTVEIRLG